MSMIGLLFGPRSTARGAFAALDVADLYEHRAFERRSISNEKLILRKRRACAIASPTVPFSLSESGAPLAFFDGVRRKISGLSRSRLKLAGQLAVRTSSSAAESSGTASELDVQPRMDGIKRS